MKYSNKIFSKNCTITIIICNFFTVDISGTRIESWLPYKFQTCLHKTNSND